MSVGEFTASNIHMDEDKREEDKKKGVVDIVKMNADIAVQVERADQVSGHGRQMDPKVIVYKICSCRGKCMRPWRDC